jgi:hypothetical protein
MSQQGDPLEGSLSKTLTSRSSELLIVVDDEDFSLAAFEGVGGDAVVLHEGEDLVARDDAEPVPFSEPR